MPKRTLNLSIDALLYDLCQETARRRRMSLAEYVREALIRQVGYDAAEEPPATPLKTLVAALKAEGRTP